MKPILILFGLAVLCAFLNTGDAVKCYTCVLGGSCNDKYGAPEGHKSKTDTCDYCIKVKTVTNGEEVTARSCGYGTIPEEKCEKNSLDLLKIDTWTCNCSGELCNAGKELTFSLGLIFGVLAFKWLL